MEDHKKTVLDNDAQIYQPRNNETQKESFKLMSFKGKVSYLWEYYKFHALIPILVVAFIVYTIYTISKPKMDIELYVALVNNTFPDEQIEELQGNLTDYLHLDTQTQEVFINYSLYLNASGEIAMSTEQALQAYIMAQEVDIMIAPESEFNRYATNGFFINLSDHLPTDLYSNLTDYFYYETDLETNAKGVYGIYLHETEAFKNYSNSLDPFVIGIIANAPNKENAIDGIRYLFNP